MATYTLSAGDHGANEKSTVAATVDTVTFVQDCDQVEVISDGAVDLYVRVDGTAPTAAGNLSYRLPAGAPSVRIITVPTSGATTVKLISSGIVKYSVSEAI